MRNKKGSMELSVNSIVILVIAIVIMGLILGFIRSKFAEVGGNLVTNEPEPQSASTQDRITLSRETLSTIPGGNAVMKMNIYNPTPNTTYSASPIIKCAGLTPMPTVKTSAKNIVSSEQIPYTVTYTFSRNTGRGSYLCSVSINGTYYAGPTGTTCPTGAVSVVPADVRAPPKPTDMTTWGTICYGPISDITPYDFVVMVN